MSEKAYNKLTKYLPCIILWCIFDRIQNKPLMKVIITLIFTVAVVLNVVAQDVKPSVIASAGNYSEVSGVSLSWTLGEPVIATATDGTNTLTQGFQQSNYDVVAIEVKPVSFLDLSVFPNPATDLLSMKWTGKEGVDVTIRLYDISGKLIFEQKTKSTVELGSLNVSNLARAQYVLQVFSEDLDFEKKFNIIKE